MSDQLEPLLSQAWPESTPAQREGIQAFYERVVDENSRQNLTRLISPADFIEGHVLDVRELLFWNKFDYPIMDLGSGVGIPGLLCAALGGRKWILAESEGHKARFLEETRRAMGLEQVEVFAGRGEDWLKSHKAGSIVARAVGPVSRIYSWLENSSTWNNLILLKGPRWDEEWKEFEETRHRGELRVIDQHSYEVGVEKKKRLIVKLARVPRGTRAN